MWQNRIAVINNNEVVPCSTHFHERNSGHFVSETAQYLSLIIGLGPMSVKQNADQQKHRIFEHNLALRM